MGWGTSKSTPLTLCFKWLCPARHHDEDGKQQVGEGSAHMEWPKDGRNHTGEAKPCKHSPGSTTTTEMRMSNAHLLSIRLRQHNVLLCVLWGRHTALALT